MPGLITAQMHPRSTRPFRGNWNPQSGPNSDTTGITERVSCYRRYNLPLAGSSRLLTVLFPITAVKRHCLPLMAFGPTISLANGREAHISFPDQHVHRRRGHDGRGVAVGFWTER